MMLKEAQKLCYYYVVSYGERNGASKMSIALHGTFCKECLSFAAMSNRSGKPPI